MKTDGESGGGRRLGRPPEITDSEQVCLAVAPGWRGCTATPRQVAVTGGHDHFVQARDVLSGAPLGSPLTGIAPVVWATGIIELDGRAVVLAGGQETTLRMWDLATGERIGAPLTGHPGPIDQVVFTRFGDRPPAVTRCRDGTARAWDLTRGEQWGASLTVPAGAIRAMTTMEIDGTRSPSTRPQRKVHAVEVRVDRVAGAARSDSTPWGCSETRAPSR